MVLFFKSRSNNLILLIFLFLSYGLTSSCIKINSNKSIITKKTFVLQTEKGNIKILLRDDKAPQTTKRIRELVDQKFYDGLTFYKVIPDFVIQTGDPEGTGRGGSGKLIKAEINDLKHIKGSVGMARRVDDINSADSQFYICLGDIPELDGEYTVFGIVKDGLNIVEQTLQGDKIIKAYLE